MATDEMLGNFSGIEGLISDIVGTVVGVLAISPDSKDEYDLVSPKFIIMLSIPNYYQI